MSTVIDPVCKMKIDPSKSAGSYEYQGTTYYFCGSGCLSRFKADPAKYLDLPTASLQATEERGESGGEPDPAPGRAGSDARPYEEMGHSGVDANARIGDAGRQLERAGDARPHGKTQGTGEAGSYVCPMHPEVRSQ